MLLVSTVLHDAAQRKTYPRLAALALTIFSYLVAAPALAQAQAQKDSAAPPAAKPSPAAPPSLPFKAPPNTRLVDGRYLMGSGLAEATRAVEKQLDRNGLAFTRKGPYRVRGLELTRFLSEDPRSRWLAIHLVRKEGRTFLDVVDR
jgi:hypothetical protein